MKLQQQNENQYTITIPKELVKGFGWQKGTDLEFKILGQQELKISVKKS
jgi:bifunctional DNA-binding transcriptional regulator/antitoxin component of YhaV-PrlF toxin-antitoxin module|tara:strand:+ start:826 stop:972 length:147 start_codon:yes stop_codon:yes gene_type:complete